ncbi:MAG: hypothetical protein DRN71_02095 [Candidatus Nanohalarchaeota archaeon]|nr:MAG: hypothetical protein DRN71_02095 [Candidatus Nanohaloarchaeota archaeon]
MDTKHDTALTPFELIDATRKFEKDSEQIRDTPIIYKRTISPEKFIKTYLPDEDETYLGYIAFEYAVRNFALIEGEDYLGDSLDDTEEEISTAINVRPFAVSKKTTKKSEKAREQLDNMVPFMDGEGTDEQIITIFKGILADEDINSLSIVSEHLPDAEAIGEYERALPDAQNVSSDIIPSNSDSPKASYRGKSYTLGEETEGISELDMALMNVIYAHFEQKREVEQKKLYKKIEDISFSPTLSEIALESIVGIMGGVDKWREQLNSQLYKLENNKEEVGVSIKKLRNWHIEMYTAQTTDAIKSKKEDLHDKLLPKSLLKHISTIIKGADNTVSDANYYYAHINSIPSESYGGPISDAAQYLRRGKQQDQIRTCADFEGNLELARLYNTLETEKREIGNYVNSNDFYKMPEVLPKKRAQDRIQNMLATTKSQFDQLEAHKKYLSRHS